MWNCLWEGGGRGSTGECAVAMEVWSFGFVVVRGGGGKGEERWWICEGDEGVAVGWSWRGVVD